MSVVIGQSKDAGKIVSFALIQLCRTPKTLHHQRSFKSQSNTHQQQFDSSSSSSTINNDFPPPPLPPKTQSGSETDSKVSNDDPSASPKINEEQKIIAKPTSSSRPVGVRRLSMKERKQEKALRRTRVKLAKARSNNIEAKLAGFLNTTASQKNQTLDDIPADRLGAEPTSNDKDEWRKAMMKLSSVFRKDFDSHETSKDGKRLRFDSSSTSTNEYDNEVTQNNSNGGGDSTAHQYFPRRDYKSRSIRASINAQSMEFARQSQPDSDPNEKTKIEHNIAPGVGIGSYPFYLAFEKTSMIYPPRDRYPPILPSVRNIDLEMTAMAFGLGRVCDVHWVEGKGNDFSDGNKEGGSWRRVIFTEQYIRQNYHSDRLDTGQGLEYIGDAVLHLISKSCIMARFPRRSMMLYNLGANWLVSNDVFGHIYIDSGLPEERKIVGEMLLRENKQFQLEKMRPFITEEQFEIRQNAPLPSSQLPILQHLRGADLFEAYVGAIYLTMGFDKASEWCTALFEPWIDRIGRTDNFLSKHTLTAAGEARARMEEQIREEVMREMREGQTEKKPRQSWLSSLSRFFKGTN